MITYVLDEQTCPGIMEEHQWKSVGGIIELENHIATPTI